MYKSSIFIDHRYSNGWQSNVVLTYHSGWPTTPAYGTTNKLPSGEYQLQKHIGKRNSANYDDYFRVDVRFNKTIQFDNSELSYFIEIFNLTDNKNECCIIDNVYSINKQGSVKVQQQRDTWFGIVPSAGILWRF